MTSPAGPSSSLQPASILLVDDHPENLLALEAILGDLGLNLVRAASGREALKRVLERDFALIMMDVSMPELDGFETAALVRQRERSRSTPIIFLTAFSKSDRQVSAGYSTGAVDYIFKPFDGAILKSKVAVFVELFHKTTEIQRQAEDLRRANEELARARADLELRVEERTAELGASNAALRAEIVERRHAEEQKALLLASAETARAEAERANRIKDEFLATLSHELRTPLNAIMGWTQVLRTKSDAATLERGIEAIHRNAESQTQLIADILDVSRIASGQFELHAIPMAVAPVVAEAVEMVHHAAADKGIVIHEDLGAELVVNADPDRLKQCVWNLASNAIKFTPAGGRIDVVLRGRGDTVEIEVRDTGRGIKPEFFPLLFDRFTQEDSSRARSQGGLGLGLAIVRHLIELQGGSVRAESAGEGAGAAFTLSLPAWSKPRTIAPPEPIAGDEEAELNGVSVLIVDDEADGREVLAMLLEDRGASVSAAASAAQGFEKLVAERPDVLVSDIAMPGGDGYSLVARVRALPAGAGGETLAIALTAFAMSKDTNQALAAGFDAHVSKPLEVGVLIALIARLVRGRAVGAPLPE